MGEMRRHSTHMNGSRSSAVLMRLTILCRSSQVRIPATIDGQRAAAGVGADADARNSRRESRKGGTQPTA
eukprot:scaffold84261_cov75-Phaeocystis_antarctica.AAC.3